MQFKIVIFYFILNWYCNWLFHAKSIIPTSKSTKINTSHRYQSVCERREGHVWSGWADKVNLQKHGVFLRQKSWSARITPEIHHRKCWAVLRSSTAVETQNTHEQRREGLEGIFRSGRIIDEWQNRPEGGNLSRAIIRRNTRKSKKQLSFAWS